ncbi:MAG: ABC transporter ATP-binding protein, partial [Clostridiales bacterium]|nr:ABC transporter ATP-binding protein [Clostridiales bacterium]
MDNRIGGGMGRSGRAYLTEEEKANRPKVTGKLLRRIAGYLKPYWKQMTLVFLAIFVSSVFKLLPSILTGRIIDDGLIGRDLNTLIILISISLGVTVAA